MSIYDTALKHLLLLIKSWCLLLADTDLLFDSSWIELYFSQMAHLNTFSTLTTVSIEAGSMTGMITGASFASIEKFTPFATSATKKAYDFQNVFSINLCSFFVFYFEKAQVRFICNCSLTRIFFL